MADPRDPRVFIGGKQRTVRFDFNALCTFEQLEGKPIHMIEDSAGLSTVRNMLYCGLLESMGGRKVDINAVGLWIHEYLQEQGSSGLDDLTAIVQTALERSMGEPGEEVAEEESGDQGNESSPGTGTSSGKAE